MTLDEALSLFLTAKEASGRSAATIDWYREQVGHFFAYLESEQIGGSSWCRPGTIDRYLAHERGLGLADSTIHARYRSLRAFFNWMVTRKYLDHSPLEPIEEPDVKEKPPRQITRDQLENLIAAIPNGPDATWTDLRDRLLLVLLFWTGLRRNEITRLEIGDVDHGKRLLLVRRGKGGRSRYVPYPEGTGPLMLNYLMARPPWGGPELFVSNDGGGGIRGRLGGEGIRQMLRRRCETANVDYINPHAFRHGFAMAMLNEGDMDVEVLSKLLGHSDTAVTKAVYANWETETLRRQYDRAAGNVGRPKPPSADS